MKRLLCLLFTSASAAPTAAADAKEIPRKNMLDVLSLAVNATTSVGCQSDLNALLSDPAFVAAQAKVNVDVFDAGYVAGLQCGQTVKPCGSHECCNVDLDWSSHLDDLRSIAAAVEANDHARKLCVLSGTESIVSSIYTIDATFDHAGFLAIPNRCTIADLAETLQIVSSTVGANNPSLRNCRYVFSSPSCGGGPGACSEWNTMTDFWPFCDPPGTHSRWEVDLSQWLGPSCRSASSAQCCYAELGYAGGAPFGTPCDQVCARYQRDGAKHAYCQMSDKSSYGNCFCSSK